jgi:hypothetical protein
VGEKGEVGGESRLLNGHSNKSPGTYGKGQITEFPTLGQLSRNHE